MGNGDKLENRFTQADVAADELRKALTVRVFGPYKGDCSYILTDTTERIRNERGYEARLCIEAPEIGQIPELKQTREDDVYNFGASLECLNQAHAAVFVFMKAEPERFDSTEENSQLPQDLNSSVVVELSKWIDMAPRTDACFVVYENGVEEELGSLVRGIVRKGDIDTRYTTTNSRAETVETLCKVISAQCRVWVDRFRPILHAEVDRR